MCPIVLGMRDHPALEPHVCVTGQHREMLDQVLGVFGVTPDVDLRLMKPNQTLAELTARVVTGVDSYLREHRPAMVLVQGDTTTVLAASLAAFYNHIPVGHVEAGLRTGNMESPWPEEANRVIASRLAALHFAPTPQARDNLLREGVPPERIHVTGNPVIDALLYAVRKTKAAPPRVDGLPGFLQPGTETTGPRMVLITGHRRESFGQGFENICRAIADLAERFPEVHFVYPVHLNPRVQEPVHRILAPQRYANLHLIAPLPYLPFVAMMNRSCLILTDSGGVQEEAPSLGKPVLVMRETTERPEAVAMGTARLVGTDRGAIGTEVARLLTDDTRYRGMAALPNPYGDGMSCARILRACEGFLCPQGAVL